MVDEKKLLEIFKQKHFQGDSYYCWINNKGDKYIVGYKNDYPMQHGNGKEWTMPIEVAEMIAGQVEPEVSDDFGGEPLKLNGEDLDKFIELIEIMNDTKYLTLHNKLLKKKLEIVTNISQNSR